MPPYAPLDERFHRHYTIDSATGCWNWTGTLNNRGYGQIESDPRTGKRRTLKAHRVSYELYVGLIPNDRVVDHACDNKRCVNPEHLQLLTNRENILRSAAPHIVAHWVQRCLRGHDLSDPAVVYVRPDNGRKVCRECRRLRQRSSYAENRR